MKSIIWALVSFLLVQNVYGQIVQTGEPVALSGKISLIRSLHPTPPWAGQKQVALRPHKQITVLPSVNDEFLSGTVKTKLIQLMFPDTGMRSRAMRSEGKNAVIYCRELFGAYTAHHTTKVLCSVDAVVYR